LKNKKKKQTFRSKFEESIANDLDNQKVEYEYESEKLQYTVERNYLPDFKLPSGIFIEAKGWFKSADQRKHRIIKKQHPNIDIRFVFQNPNVRVQGSRMTCAEWCEKYGFKFASKLIPKEWL
tara:strand:- start:4859 stop:5224 length:366 start_codon:yes stop_codon:yes gene_type:complete